MRERESTCAGASRGRGRGRGRERIPSRLRTASTEPDAGLELNNREIMTWAETKSGTLNRLTTEAPHQSFSRARCCPLSRVFADVLADRDLCPLGHTCPLGPSALPRSRLVKQTQTHFPDFSRTPHLGPHGTPSRLCEPLCPPTPCPSDYGPGEGGHPDTLALSVPLYFIGSNKCPC